MFGRTGRGRIPFPPRGCASTASPSLPSSELVVQWHRVALAKGVDRRTDAPEGKTPSPGYEFPGRERLPQTRGNDADRDKDDPANDHRRCQKESYSSRTVPKLPAVPIEKPSRWCLRRCRRDAEYQQLQ